VTHLAIPSTRRSRKTGFSSTLASLRLDFCSNVKIFDAAVRNIIYFFQRADGAKSKPERRVHHETFGEVTLLPTDEQAKLTRRVFLPRAGEHSGFSGATLQIGQICYLSYGLAASSDEKLHKGEFVTEDVTQDVEDSREAITRSDCTVYFVSRSRSKSHELIDMKETKKRDRLVELGGADRIGSCAWFGVAQPTEWQRIRNESDTAFIFARADFVNVYGSVKPAQSAA
jgi:hypothetical protein